MKVVQQSKQLKVKNWGDVGGGSGGDEQRKHGPLLPNTIRCIVCGPSNCGKTNVVFSMLFDANGLFSKRVRFSISYT